jgi:hypothetical protein
MDDVEDSSCHISASARNSYRPRLRGTHERPATTGAEVKPPVALLATSRCFAIRGWRPAFVSARGRGATAVVVIPSVRKRQRRGPAKAVVGVLSDPPVLVFSLSIGKGLMTISMPDRFRLAAPRGRRRRIGMAMGLLEQSRLASCPRPGRTKSTPLTRRRIAVWRLEWPPRVARARRDGRDGSCASGRPRDVGHRCERWRALERERGAAFEPPLASQVLLGIKQLEPNGQVLLRRPDCVRGHSGPPGVGGLPSAY